MLNKKLITSFIVLVGVVSSVSITQAEETKSLKLIRNMPNGQIDWLNKVIRVKGNGVPPDSGGITQKRLKARVAARIDAYRNLAETVECVQVSSETDVKNFVAENDVIKLRVDAVVKGARQSGKEKLLPDGSIEVELFLPMFGNASLATALDLGNYAKNKTTLAYTLPIMVASLNDFAITESKSYKISENINTDATGLIIDASSLEIEPAMSPFIIGGGRIVYTGSKFDIDPKTIVKNGITDYTDSLEKAKKNIERIGNSPIIIEASGATGIPSKTNILLDELSINNLINSNEKTHFLNKLGVVIVI